MEQFRHRPYVFGNSSLHSGSDSQGRVDAHEVVPREMQADSSFQVVEFLAESIRQSGKPANLHPHR